MNSEYRKITKFYTRFNRFKQKFFQLVLWRFLYLSQRTIWFIFASILNILNFAPFLFFSFFLFRVVFNSCHSHIYYTAQTAVHMSSSKSWILKSTIRCWLLTVVTRILILVLSLFITGANDFHTVGLPTYLILRTTSTRTFTISGKCWRISMQYFEKRKSISASWNLEEINPFLTGSISNQAGLTLQVKESFEDKICCFSEYIKVSFVRRTPKVSLDGVVLRTENSFSRTSAVKF